MNSSKTSGVITGGLAVRSGVIKTDSTMSRSSMYCFSLVISLWMILGKRIGRQLEVDKHQRTFVG